MRATPEAPSAAAFDMKSTHLPLIAVGLKTADLSVLANDLAQRVGATPNFFDRDPVVIDLSALRDEAAPLDFEALLALLREYKMIPVAARGGSAEQMAAAAGLGLGDAPDLPPPTSARHDDTTRTTTRPEVVDDLSGGGTTPTVIIDKPLRSGQRVYARGGDIVVLDIVSFDAEVIADGNIHVYAPLRGKAIAGARGNVQARIFATSLEPQLVSIAGIYRTTETQIPADVLGKAAQIYLVGEQLVMEPLAR